MKTLKTLFTEHPREVGMSYFGHLGYAFTIIGRLSGCVLACLVHAFLPFLFTNTTSRTIHALHEELHHRK